MFVAHDPTSASPMHELLPLPQFSPPPLPPGPPSMSSIGTTTPVPPVCPPHTAREISLKVKVKVNTSPYKTFSKPHSSQKSKTKTKPPHLWCWPRALLWTGSCCPGSPATPSYTDPVFFFLLLAPTKPGPLQGSVLAPPSACPMLPLIHPLLSPRPLVVAQMPPPERPQLMPSLTLPVLFPSRPFAQSNLIFFILPFFYRLPH